MFEHRKKDIYLVPRLFTQVRDDTCHEIRAEIEVCDLSQKSAHTVQRWFCKFAASYFLFRDEESL